MPKIKILDREGNPLTHLLESIELKESYVLLPIEPTKNMLSNLVITDNNDWYIGKEAQINGSDIPPNYEMEEAYGRYKRLIEPFLNSVKKVGEDNA